MQLDTKSLSRKRSLSRVAIGRGFGTAPEEGDSRQAWHEFTEQIESLWDQLIAKNLKPGEISTRPRHAGSEASGDEIRPRTNRYDRNGIRFHREQFRGGGAPHHYDVEL